MADKQVTIKVRGEIVTDMERAFGLSFEDEDMDDIVHLAFQQWFETMFGRRRYRSVTELYLDWLREIFSSHLILSEPSEQVLYSSLNFPYGQANYLARVLREYRPIHLRRRFLEELKDKLVHRKSDAEEYIKEGRGYERLSLTLSKSARRELDHLLSVLIEEGEEVHPLRTEGTFGSTYVIVLLAAGDLPLLADQIEIRLEESTEE